MNEVTSEHDERDKELNKSFFQRSQSFFKKIQNNWRTNEGS